MSLKDKWKETGKNIGHAFSNFGKAMGTTAKVVFSDEGNKVDENGESELKKAWKDTGKGFGEAGKSFGQAAGGTAKKVVDDIDEEERKNEEQKQHKDGIDKENAVDAEIVEDNKKEEN